MLAYYNEHDPYAAAWLRNLQTANLISPGPVDERDIRDVRPSDVRGFARAHFFAGIGVWDYALQLAGWPADRPVWTGSCPCQPFSAAGRRGGVDDERHLWPVWFELIRACRPNVILGEQVASSAVIGGARVGPGVPASLPFAASSERSDPARQAAGFGKDARVRLVGSRRRDTGPDRYWRMRTDGPAVQSGRGTDVGQPIAGSSASDAGLCHLEHPGDLPRGEQRDRRLGREQAAGFGARNSSEETNPFVRALDCARRELEEAARGAWLAVVQADLESAGYRLGPADIPAAGVGAPHIRQRLWFVADAGGERLDGEPAQLRRSGSGGRDAADYVEVAGRGEAGIVADATDARQFGSQDAGADRGDPCAMQSRGQGLAGLREPQRSGAPRCLDDTISIGRRAVGVGHNSGHVGIVPDAAKPNGFWSDADWIACRDGKARPVEPGTFPLAHGSPARVGRLRAYGNAINAEAAAAFIRACLDALPAGAPADRRVQLEDIFA